MKYGKYGLFVEEYDCVLVGGRFYGIVLKKLKDSVVLLLNNNIGYYTMKIEPFIKSVELIKRQIPKHKLPWIRR